MNLQSSSPSQRQWPQRQWPLAAACVGGALLLGLLVMSIGCQDASTTNAGGPKTDGDDPKAAPVPVEPMLDGWTQPGALIVLTGEQHGYLEPCGCSETQSGGLARRANFFDKIEQRGWPIVGFDLGGVVKRSRRQSQLKFNFARDAMEQMGYRGLAVGVEDLELGPDFLFQAHSEAAANDDFTLPFLAANVTIYTTKDHGMPQEFVITQVGDVKIGVTAIYGETSKPPLKEVGLLDDEGLLKIDDPKQVLADIVPKLEANQPDVMILLSHALPAESKALAEAFPQFDIVVTAGSAEDPLIDPEIVGKTWLLQVGQKGKNLGIVGVYPGQDPPLKYELVNLDNQRFENAPELRERMIEYQERLAKEQLAITEPAVPLAHGGEYLGAKACGKCHTKAYATWSKTKHAHAFDSLSKGREGMEASWVDRTQDPECLACHVTGWSPQEVLRFETGFQSMDKTPHLAGQQCENCHGPGGTHATLEEAILKGGPLTEETRTERLAMHLAKEQARTAVCLKCHDGDNSPNFDFEKYWPKVEHRGKD